jgi:tRNA (guanine-N7-)-methyltransferase
MTNDNASSPKNQRPVRSYVLRQGRMTPAQEKALRDLWVIYGIDDNNKLISVKNPAVLEIGFGMGQSLAAQAKAYPENQYIGIEVHRPGVGSLLLQLHKENIHNIRIFCRDAIEVLRNNIPDDSLDKIQIFFPDPWPKKRHHKRRLIQLDFMILLHQKLKSGGILHIATDWEDYAVHILEIMSQIELFEKIDIPHDRPPTKFELRGKKLGHQVWDLIFRTK